MKYHFKIHQEQKWYWAHGIELPGCVTQGRTLKELAKNMQEALNLIVDEPTDSTDLVPLPDESIKLAKNIVEVPLDPHVAFAFLVRYHRIHHGLTQQEAAEKMGFERIYSYQRLETSRCNPTLSMLAKIKKLFPEFSIDYVFGLDC